MTGYILLLALVGFVQGQTTLGPYIVDSAISVSGLSSGSYMASQFHIAQSKKMIGAALFAGGPYYCAAGNLASATTTCMLFPTSIKLDNLYSKAQSYESSGLIDSLSNLANDKVFIFSGSKDSVVVPGVIKKQEEFYRKYTNAANIKTVYDIAAQHGMPTDFYGGTCGTSNTQYINNCNYNGAYEALNHIYGGLQKPSPGAALTGQLILFDQSEFFKPTSPSTYGMDTAGYIYIPASCLSGTSGPDSPDGPDDPDVPPTCRRNGAKCRLHIVFHGCKQGREKLDDKYARNTGYNQVADLNNLIILYPQAKSNMSNINGCWDWWGFSSKEYANKNGYQMMGVERMMLRILGEY